MTWLNKLDFVHNAFPLQMALHSQVIDYLLDTTKLNCQVHVTVIPFLSLVQVVCGQYAKFLAHFSAFLTGNNRKHLC